MFTKLNNDEFIVKGRGCVDGRNHQNCISKEDTSSPTMLTEGLILSCVIGAMKCRDVATADIPVVFLQTYYDKGDIHIITEEGIVTLIEEIDPYYYKKIIYIETMHVYRT